MKAETTDPRTVIIQFAHPAEMANQVQAIMEYLCKAQITFVPDEWMSLEFRDAEAADAFRDGYLTSTQGYYQPPKPKTEAYFHNLWMTTGPEIRAKVTQAQAEYDRIMGTSNEFRRSSTD